MNYQYYNSQVTTGLQADLSAQLLAKTSIIQVISIGFSGTCTVVPNMCTQDTIVKLDGVPVVENVFCENLDGHTCNITVYFKTEQLVSSIVTVQHPDDYAYNQGWMWQFTISDDINFHGQTIGRTLEPPNPDNEVFHGAVGSQDFLLITPFQYISEIDNSQNFDTIMLNLTGTPQRGSSFTATKLLPSG